MYKLASEIYFYRDALISDASFFLTLLNDDKWLRFIGDRHVRTISDAEKFIVNQVEPVYSNQGLGMKIICRKDDETPLGLIGLLQRDYLDSIDLGYALLQSARGKGVISESIPIFTNLAFDVRKSTRLYATVNSDNVASIRILKNNSFCLSPNQKAVADLCGNTLLFVRYRDGHSFCRQ